MFVFLWSKHACDDNSASTFNYYSKFNSILYKKKCTCNILTTFYAILQNMHFFNNKCSQALTRSASVKIRVGIAVACSVCAHKKRKDTKTQNETHTSREKVLDLSLVLNETGLGEGRGTDAGRRIFEPLNRFGTQNNRCYRTFNTSTPNLCLIRRVCILIL